MHTDVFVQEECDAAKLVIYSDGLSEAKNFKGNFFGEEGIITAIEKTGEEGCLMALIDAMSIHLGEEVAHDDISIVMVDYSLE